MPALESLISHGTPNFSTSMALSQRHSSSSVRFEAFHIRRIAIDGPSLHLKQSFTPKGLGHCSIVVGGASKAVLRRFVVSFAASHEESENSNIEVEKVKNEFDKQDIESEEAWKQNLESVKEQVLKIQGMSQEAYELYSKKATIILKDASEQLRIQAEKAKQDLGVLAAEMTADGNEYFSLAVEKSPKSLKNIAKTFTSSTANIKGISEVRDFHLGIPYGLLLSVGGFLSFLLTGSIPAIRFGVVLGGTLLALSVSSLRAWNNQDSYAPYLKGQAAIALIIFIREMRLLCQRPSFPSSFITLFSGWVVVFYLYRILLNGKEKRSL